MLPSPRRCAVPARILGVLLVATLAFAGPAPAQAQSQESPRAAAKSARQCLPDATPKKSLVVRGKLSCKRARGIYPSAVETAAHTKELGLRTFRFQGFRCTLRAGDGFRFTCRDRDGKPRRSFTVKYVS
ncbi:hypothetical protein [Nocardioides sp. W7]|uniref:hypothetical protein n=1 Tax=Nocardioides sp. W7 TaxID=2931390 RepID=UPI001FD40B77|nr:hypothetical protein [Nocardioides sp. W7]